MNKTVSINLGGQVFQIDEDAYERLWKYLEAIKLKYANTPGGDEIIADIESRLAEMFYEALGNLRQVISATDVEAVISIMGQPEDFEVPLEDEETLGDAGQTKSSQNGAGKYQRRLFRNPEDKVVGGVASGISAYLGMEDPVWIRIALVIALFASFGTSFIVYIILMMIIPEAKTASEKLQMRGEPINIDNIERTIRDEFQDLENRLNNGKPSDKARGVVTKLVDFLGTVFNLLFMAIGKLIGFTLATLGIALLISLVLGVSIPAAVKGGISLTMLPHVFSSNAQLVAAVVGLSFLLLIPILSLIYSGLAILIKRPTKNRGLGFTAFGLLVVGLVLTVYSLSQVRTEFEVTRKHTTTQVLTQPMDGVLRLELTDDPRNLDGFKTLLGFGAFRKENDTIYHRNNAIDRRDKPVLLDIVRSPSNDFLLETTISADGANSDEAYFRSKNIQYVIRQDSAHLYFPTYMAYPIADKIRGQQVRLVLNVPEGQSVFIGQEVRELIYDIKNVTDTYDGDMVGHTWKMTPAGLTCLDCGHGNSNTTAATQSIAGVPAAPAYPTPPAYPTNHVAKDLSSFSSVEVSGAIEFYLVPGDPKIVFESAKAQSELEVDLSGGRLTVESTGGWNLLKDEKRIWIYTPAVSRVIVSGASNGHIGGYSVPSLDVELSGASECELSVGAGMLKLHASGASELTANGEANELDAEVSGASQLAAFNLVCGTAKVHSSGASSAEVNVTHKLTAESSGASDIDYKGNPSVSSSSSGGSSINAKP